MLNRFPYNGGHLLIAPRRHLASPELLSKSEREALAETVSESLRILRRAFKPGGFNVGLNLGVAAGAGIADHMHWHVVPRWNGDTNFMPVIGSTRVISEHLDAAYKILLPLFNLRGRALS